MSSSRSSGEYFFISYSRHDSVRVEPIVHLLRQNGIRLWRDVEQLHPGDRWQEVIVNALRGASGLIVFISNESIRSEWVMTELNWAAQGRSIPIIPVLLEQVDRLPVGLEEYQYIDMTNLDSETAFQASFDRLLTALRYWTETPREPVNSLPLERIAIETAQEAERGVVDTRAGEVLNTIFVVHGHDTALLTELRDYLGSIGVTPIILSEQENRQDHLFEKFAQESARADHAIVLISSDDVGAARREYDSEYQGARAGDRALRFRARQNVVLEMGFFYGRLGTEHVFVLQKQADTYFPVFERPSDLDGRLFEEYDAAGEWRETLRMWLERAGFDLA